MSPWPSWYRKCVNTTRYVTPTPRQNLLHLEHRGSTPRDRLRRLGAGAGVAHAEWALCRIRRKRHLSLRLGPIGGTALVFYPEIV